MTEKPWGFPEQACMDTPVSSPTGEMIRLYVASPGTPAPRYTSEIRLAEDQMQRLMRCILAGCVLITDREADQLTYQDCWGGAEVMLENEPKHEPATDVEIEQLKTQIECLQSNLNAANDRAQIAQQEVERLKAWIPKERLKVSIRYHASLGYCVHLYVPLEIQSVRVSPWLSSQDTAIKWSEDHWLEVVE